MTGLNHWDKFWKNWSHVHSPLRPNTEDIAHFSQIIPDLPPQARILLLGVTTEIRAMDWPKDSTLYSVDNNMHIIQGLWHPTAHCPSHIICADWSNLPLKNSFFDLIIGDGVTTPLDFPRTFNQVINEFHRVLKPHGKLMLRHFFKDPNGPNEEQVWLNAYKNKYPNFSAFKWHLAHALQTSPLKGIKVTDLLASWEKHLPYWAENGRELPWPLGEIATIEVYRTSRLRYIYLNSREMDTVFKKTFKRTRSFYGTYELGEHCPVVIYDKIL